MDHLQHQVNLSEFLERFPRDRYPAGPRRDQERILEFVAQNGLKTMVVEAPTGIGKTGVECAILEAMKAKMRNKPMFLITPNKTIVEQINQELPGHFKVALGRNEHQCLYYQGEVRADDVPCSMLRDCPHRVDQTTGQTLQEHVAPCPYLLQKYQAKQGGIILCTMSFYLFTHLFSREFDLPPVLVIDEAHRIADIVRNSLSYEITDWHLEQAVQLLERIGATEKETIQRFLSAIKRITKARKRPPNLEVLIEDEEVRRLIEILDEIDERELAKKIERAVQDHLIDPVADRVILTKLEILVRDLRRYIHSFEYSLETAERKPLDYTCTFYRRERGEHDKVQYKLVIRAYYVAPLIRKMLPPFTVCFSATIGDPEIFGFETGIGRERGIQRAPFLSLSSPFPVGHTRIYLPNDTPNLAMNARRRQDMTHSLRLIVRACRRLADNGYRSLVVVISNKEREKLLELASEEGVKTVSYGNGYTAKEAALAFRSGEGEVLVGTAANYSEGVDLPKQIAPVIFFLRPGYPNPTEASTQFEERRWRSQRWALWNWRVMRQALQVRGRNVRGRNDLGVTIFLSQQFKRVLFASLPEWLETAYRSNLSFEQCLKDTEGLLASQD